MQALEEDLRRLRENQFKTSEDSVTEKSLVDWNTCVQSDIEQDLKHGLIVILIF